MVKSLFKKLNFSSSDIIALDVSSKNLTATAGIVKAGKLLSIKQFESVSYSGYADGQWFDLDELKEKAASVVKKAMQGCKIKKKVLHVSVPAEFLAVTVKNVDVEYEHVHKLTNADFDYFYYKGDTYGDGDFLPVNASGISFSIDGESNTFESPIGENAQSLSGEVSYLFCEKAYTKVFDDVASRCGFKEVLYYATPFVENLTIFEKEERFNELLLIDVGYISSSVSTFKGDGVLALKSFSFGLGHIAAMVYEALEIPFEDAEEVLRKVDLNLNYDGEIFETANGYNVDMSDVAQIAIDSIRVLSATIKDAIIECGYQGSATLPFYVTGEGLELRGLTKYLERGLIKELECVAPKFPAYSKPQYSSAVSLINIAAEINENRAGRLIYN